MSFLSGQKILLSVIFYVKIFFQKSCYFKVFVRERIYKRNQVVEKKNGHS